MTKALTPTENSKKQSDNTKTPPKTSITTTIADRQLRTVSWSNDSHPTGVVKPVYRIQTSHSPQQQCNQTNMVRSCLQYKQTYTNMDAY